MEEQKLLKRRRKALQENNEVVLISVCTDLANLYFEEGRYDFAIEEYTTLANIYEKRKCHLEYAVVNRGIGEAYLGLQNFDKALHYQKIYLNTVKEIKNKLEEQRALATIGHTYLSSYLDMSEPNRDALNSANKFFTKSLGVVQSLSEQVSKREIADMSARLLCNLGLVQECLGNFDRASELINTSINLCKIHDLYEQLQRGYVADASLSVKKGDSKSAIQKYNLAEEAAKKLRSQPGILAGIYLSKSEILIKLGDLHAAKNILHKAYKLKIPESKDRTTIENNLKVVASMTLNEDKILKTETSNYAELKKLYEKMGDGCCELKQFDKAIEYYKKMLDVAVKAGLTGPELGTCYYSLAETYKDNGQFDEAVIFFEQELELCKSLKDSLNTLSKIADTKEAADAPVVDVQAVYKRAVESCQNENNKHEEGRMVKRCIAYLRRQKQHSEAFKMERILSKLNYSSSDSESEGSETQPGSVVGADIDLETLTGSSMKSLENLTKLNLNCTGLQSAHVQILVNKLDPDVAYKLTDLDVSDNFLEDRCFESLAFLTRRFQLKKLNLSGNNFSNVNQQLMLHLDQVEDFDISDNDLSNIALLKLLSWLQSSNLRSIDVSRNSVTRGFVTELLDNWSEASSLKICKLSRCHMVDADIFKLLQIAPTLEVLDASYNNLTSISLRRLFESKITTLDLYGCNDIFEYFTDFSKFLDESSRDLDKGKTLKLTFPENSHDKTEYLIQMWNDLYGSNTIVELDSRFLCLSVSK